MPIKLVATPDKECSKPLYLTGQSKNGLQGIGFGLDPLQGI